MIPSSVFVVFASKKSANDKANLAEKILANKGLFSK